MKNIIFILLFVNLVADGLLVLDPKAPQAATSLVNPDLSPQHITKEDFRAEMERQMAAKHIAKEDAVTLVQGTFLPWQKDAYFDYAFNNRVNGLTLARLDKSQKLAKENGFQTAAIAAMRGGALFLTEPLENGEVLPMAINTMPTATVVETLDEAYVGSYPGKIDPTGSHTHLEKIDDIVDTGNSVALLVEKAVEFLIESGAEELAKTATFKIFVSYAKEGRPHKSFDTFYFPERLYEAYKAQCEENEVLPLPFDTSNPALQSELDKINADKAYAPLPGLMVRLHMFFVHNWIKKNLGKDAPANIRMVSRDLLDAACKYADNILKRVEVEATISSASMKKFFNTESPWIVLPSESNGPSAMLPSYEQFSNSLQSALTPEQLDDLDIIFPAKDQGTCTSHVSAETFVGISNMFSDVYKIAHTHTTVACSSNPTILCQELKKKSTPGSTALLAGFKSLSDYPAEFIDFLKKTHKDVVVADLRDFAQENNFCSPPMDPARQIEVVEAKIQDCDSAVYSVESTPNLVDRLIPLYSQVGADLQ